MAEQHRRKVAKASLPQGTQIVSDLAQIRALADPLRLRILGALGGVPRTTKQVAEILGEKPTKLYHHVEALERVGLIHLKETRPNRGTVEKYYQAVAARFQVAASALSPGAEISAPEAMLTSILDTARKELVACLRPAARPSPEQAPFVARVTVNGSDKKVQAVRRRLLQWVEKLRAAEDESAHTGGATCMFTVVFCRTEPG